MMSDKSKNCKIRRVEDKENSVQQDQSTEVRELCRRKYYTRAAKKLEEKDSCIREVEGAKKRREEILKSKHSSEKEAEIYKKTFPRFKRKMIELYGVTFFYNGGSWHGEMSTRYRHSHLRKSMRFLKENMKNSDDE